MSNIPTSARTPSSARGARTPSSARGARGETPSSARNSARPRRASEIVPNSARKNSTIAADAKEALQTQANAMKVYVRVRPYSEREISFKGSAHSTIRIDAENPAIITILDPANQFRQQSTYKFTRCFWSVFQKSETDICNAVDTVLVGGMNAQPQGRRSRAASIMQNAQSEGAPSQQPAYVGSGSNAVNTVDPEVTHPPYAGQSEVYKYVGRPVLENTLDGYNGCVFAYGQTGSGKTFTMMGYAPTVSDAKKIRNRRESTVGGKDLDNSNSALLDSTSNFERQNSPNAAIPYEEDSADMDDVVDKTNMDPNDLQGIIPRICSELFEGLREKRQTDESRSFRVSVSYYEIYNEKVYDLIRPRGEADLKIRNNPSTGPFVEGLASKQVLREEDIARVIRKGMQERHTAATKYNDRSSRSHAILSLNIVQMYFEHEEMCTLESKLNLVDLAGSERTGKGGAEGIEKKTGININLSLTVLGRVIDCLADLSQNKSLSVPVPYRDSNLTWLLSDSIGGNSQTSMVATISPHSINYEEMRQTLRYASRAKQIINRATRNEDPQVALIRRLRGEVERLNTILKESGSCEYTNEYVESLKQRILELEKQCALQEEQLGSLRAELEMAGLVDPTKAENGKSENVARGAVNLKAANDSLTQQLQEAHDEIDSLQKQLLEKAKQTDNTNALKGVQAELETVRKQLAKSNLCATEKDLLVKKYTKLFFTPTMDDFNEKMETKMFLFFDGVEAIIRAKDKNVEAAKNKGQVDLMMQINEMQKKHEEEIADIYTRNRNQIDDLEELNRQRIAEMEKQLASSTGGADERLNSAKNALEQEKKRNQLERENLKLHYEDELNKARLNYQEDLQKLRDSLGSGTQDRQRLSETVRTMEEARARDVKALKEEISNLTKKNEADIQRLRTQHASELSKKSSELEEKDRRRADLESELAKLRKENVDLNTARKNAEKGTNDQLKDSLQQQEHLLAVISILISDYSAQSPAFDSDIEVLKGILEDRDYGAFRQRAKDMSYNKTTRKDYGQDLSKVDEQKKQESREYLEFVENMRKNREDRMAKLKSLKDDVYQAKTRQN